MLSFWDAKDPRKDKYRNPKKGEILEKRTKVTVTDSDKEIGRTTVVKKSHDKSGFWTEKETDNKSTLRLKRENFKTKEDSVEDMEQIDTRELSEGCLLYTSPSPRDRS